MEPTQKIYKYCLMQIYTSTGMGTDRCDIRFEDKRIVLSYINDEHLVWQCKEETPGHYLCKAEGQNVKGTGSLHKYQKGGFLEGYWNVQRGVNGADGMWRIVLENPWREPKKGDYVTICDEDDGNWVKCKITGIDDKSTIKTKEYQPVLIADFGQVWTYAKD